VNGGLSHWIDVLSGISQGRVLGLVLFIIYINDLPKVVRNMAILFADDTKIYSPLRYQEYHRGWQEDLDNLVRWSKKWHLCFNTTKCKVMNYGRVNPNI